MTEETNYLIFLVYVYLNTVIIYAFVSFYYS